MTSKTWTEQRIEKVVHGDLAAFAELAQEPAALLDQSGEGVRTYMVSARAVGDVLSALQRGTGAPELVQRWASFIRRGYLAGAHRGPIRPLWIDYEPAVEDDIAHVLSRLDEIGDALDGEVSAQEIDELLALLAA